MPNRPPKIIIINKEPCLPSTDTKLGNNLIVLTRPKSDTPGTEDHGLLRFVYHGFAEGSR